AVDQRGRFLDRGERVDELARHALAADPEVLERALGLSAPVARGVDFDRAHAVGLGAGGHTWLLPPHSTLENQMSSSLACIARPPWARRLSARAAASAKLGSRLSTISR